MLRHVISWNFKEGLSEEENRENARRIKAELEALAGVIPEIKELKVYIDMLPTSNKNVFLTSLFEDEKALEAYIVHPEHQKAGAFVRSVLQDRACADFYE